MELDLKKKIMIGVIIVAVIGIFIYLYYDYANSRDEGISILEENDLETGKSEVSQLENNIATDTEGGSEDTIIVHIAGAVNNPRNCKIE